MTIKHSEIYLKTGVIKQDHLKPLIMTFIAKNKTIVLTFLWSCLTSPLVLPACVLSLPSFSFLSLSFCSFALPHPLIWSFPFLSFVPFPFLVHHLLPSLFLSFPSLSFHFSNIFLSYLLSSPLFSVLWSHSISLAEKQQPSMSHSSGKLLLFYDFSNHIQK